ncbi:uncharacterized protein [Euwallacea fornicatus]|uniref:uncharacterized protein isoform X2 n=1 Tax=Euwallacea fornicatus TaxID=995702 RepID=UPI00338DF803
MSVCKLLARFQQKQMQEKEEKLTKMYESQQQRAFEKVGRSSAGSSGSNASSNGSSITSNVSIGSTGKGKVRQMFEERRQKAGIDKSYPLEPLKTKTNTRGPNGKTTATSTVKSSAMKSVSQTRNGKPVLHQKEAYRKAYNNNYSNGNFEDGGARTTAGYDILDGPNSDLVEFINPNIDDEEDIDNLPKIGFNDSYKQQPLYMTGKLANVGGKLPSQRFIENNNNNNNEEKTGGNVVSQKPEGVLKNEPKMAAKKPIAKTKPPPRSNSSVSSTTSQSPRHSPTQADHNVTASKQQAGSGAPSRAPHTNTRPSTKQIAKSSVTRDDLTDCKFCGRRFATDRLKVHEDICGKTGKKKRKAFDATKHRVQGTELESYVMKGGKKGASSKKNMDMAPTSKNINKISSKPSASSKAGNWRKTHEEFISAIRAAKQAQAHVAKGGKLTDLPPPPPSSNPDYVQCPHCGRRFNESAAERHIPKCANYEFNKPKGGPQKSKPGKR